MASYSADVQVTVLTLPSAYTVIFLATAISASFQAKVNTILGLTLLKIGRYNASQGREQYNAYSRRQ